MLSYYAPLTLIAWGGSGQDSSQSQAGNDNNMGRLDAAAMPANVTRSAMIEVKFIS